MAKAIASFVGFVDGMQVAVQESAELPDDDPVVKANPDMFGKAPARKTTTKPTAKRTTKK